MGSRSKCPFSECIRRTVFRSSLDIPLDQGTGTNIGERTKWEKKQA